MPVTKRKRVCNLIVDQAGRPNHKDFKYCQLLREAELQELRMKSLGWPEVAKTISLFGEVSQIGHPQSADSASLENTV